MPAIGHTVWAIAEGYIPPDDDASKDPALLSHETACLLNTGEADAQVEITLYFEERDPAGPYRVIVPARRTVHLRFNDLTDPERIPHGLAYSSVFVSTQPIVVQHTRLDSRLPPRALLSTIAYAGTP